MGLFTSMRADRLLATVREASDPGRPEIRAALAKLVALGPSVVPLVIAELARSEKKPLWLSSMCWRNWPMPVPSRNT